MNRGYDLTVARTEERRDAIGGLHGDALSVRRDQSVGLNLRDVRNMGVPKFEDLGAVNLMHVKGFFWEGGREKFVRAIHAARFYPKGRCNCVDR